MFSGSIDYVYIFTAYTEISYPTRPSERSPFVLLHFDCMFWRFFLIDSQKCMLLIDDHRLVSSFFEDPSRVHLSADLIKRTNQSPPNYQTFDLS